MGTDYIVFVHGVNNRVKENFERQAMSTFAQIKAHIDPNSSRVLKPVILFWGNVAEEPINLLLEGIDASSAWKQYWFKEFRTAQVINFVGDAALYLSRNVSVQIINQMIEQSLKQMDLNLDDVKNKSPQDGDRLHLVTHSWGTVILFDIMFADRWEDSNLPPNILELVDNIRSILFGIGKPAIKNLGIPIASIHTMGSPISLFNLLNASGARSFNLTPKLKDFLTSLHAITGTALPWYNYAHPGDPIAYPLKGVMDLSLDQAKSFVQVEDMMIPVNFLDRILGTGILSILNGGKAHSSYWTNQSVAKTIAEVIKSH